MRSKFVALVGKSKRSRSFRRARATVAVMAILAPACTLGCSMLNMGQSGSSTTSGGSDNLPPNANLGNFTLNLKLLQTSCGEGALGMQDAWSFDVALSYTGETATWSSGGAMIQGAFDSAAKTLDFTSSVTIDMRKNDPAGPEALPACSIKRSDDAAFSIDAVDHPTALSGELTYTFDIEPASNCADLIYGAMPQFKTLPCTVTYAVTGAPKAAKK